MSTPAQQNALVDYFLKSYQKRYDKKPLFNRQKATWTMKALLYDYSTKECKELIDFYIHVYKANSHSLEWFGFNYDKLIQAKQDHDEQVEVFQRLSEESADRERLWKERIERIKGNTSGTGKG
jgi:hypothetical protein